MTDPKTGCSESKRCFRCGADKARAEFYRHPQMGDGLLGKCKACTRADVRKGRGDQTRAYDRRRYQERTHEHKARIAVQVAIANGTLIRPEGCWACGCPGTTEAHHADYYNQLGVVFLCKECHMACHRMTTAISKGNEYAAKLAIEIRQMEKELEQVA